MILPLEHQNASPDAAWEFLLLFFVFGCSSVLKRLECLLALNTLHHPQQLTLEPRAASSQILVNSRFVSIAYSTI